MATTPGKKEPKVTAPKDEAQNDPKPTAAPVAPSQSSDDPQTPPHEAEVSTNPEPQPSKLKSVEDVTREVLAGHWGPTFAAAQEKLDKAGYDVEDVWAEYQRRKAGGAPSAF